MTYNECSTYPLSSMISFSGFIPAPIYFGVMIQSNCLMQQMSCGEFGVCQVYDRVGFRLSYHGLIIGLKAISLVGFIVAFWSVRNERQVSTSGHSLIITRMFPANKVQFCMSFYVAIRLWRGFVIIRNCISYTRRYVRTLPLMVED